MDGGKSLPLTPAGSMLLDVLRFAAAMAVVLGHFSHPDFSTGWPYRLDLSLDGVAVFFVLSGFVIRLITTARPVTAREYAVDRASRIYSVVLPAVLFTLVAAALLGSFGNPRTAALQVAANLSFTAQCWGLDLPVLSNSVFWSLCYECFFYALYGFGLFTRGRFRVIALLLLAVLAGPPILFMLPLWLLGCLLHDVYQRLRHRPFHNALWIGLACLPLLAIAALATRHLAVLRNTLRPLYLAIHGMAQQHRMHLLMRADPRFYWIGIPFGALLLLALLLLEPALLRSSARNLGVVRVVANGTFALYLLHRPLLQITAAWVHYERASLLQQAAVVSGVVSLCVLAQLPMDRLKTVVREALHARSAATGAFSNH